MKKLIATLRILVLGGFAATGFAEEPKEPKSLLDEILTSMTEAYGGEAFEGIRAYRIAERYIAPATGQSWSPSSVDIGRMNQLFVHDLESGAVYFENWFRGRGGVFPSLIQVESGEARNINLVDARYGEANSADPYQIAGGTMRTTDTLLARELLESHESAEYLGEETFMNRLHYKVRFPFPSSPDLTVFIDTDHGLIHRMTRENPQLGLLEYVSLDQETRNGITRATRTDFSVAGAPNLISEGRVIEFNPELDAGLFALPGGLTQEGDRTDTSVMIVNRLGDHAYHIGQGNAYSIFVDTGTELIASGGYAGLRERLSKYREESGNYRALGYLVVSHHHSDHLGGLGEALELGATLVTVAGNHEAIAEAIAAAGHGGAGNGRFLDVHERLSFGTGQRRVELYDVSTIHSYSNLLFFLPGERVLFMVDHFGTPYATGVPTANENTVSRAKALEGLDGEVSRIVTAHGARIFSMRDFKQAVSDYQMFECPPGRKLCPG